jgi:predicted deacylase
MAWEWFEAGGVRVPPGGRGRGALKVGAWADGSALEIPFHVVRGVREGPVLYVQAACHGAEVNGVEVIRRLLGVVRPERLAGTLVAVPVANVVAFVHHQRRTPFDHEDMNRVFPGKADGGISQRMAHALFEGLIARATCVVDLHTGGGAMVTHCRLALAGESGVLARVFGTELLVREPLDDDFMARRFDGKLRLAAERRGIASITPELGAHGRLQEDSVATGLRGMLNVMKHTGMLEGRPDLPPRQLVVSYSSGTQLVVESGGFFVSDVVPGQFVKEGDSLGTVFGIATMEPVQSFAAPADAVVVSYSESPVVNLGDRVFMLGKVEETLVNDAG